MNSCSYGEKYENKKTLIVQIRFTFLNICDVIYGTPLYSDCLDITHFGQKKKIVANLKPF